MISEVRQGLCGKGDICHFPQPEPGLQSLSLVFSQFAAQLIVMALKLEIKLHT